MRRTRKVAVVWVLACVGALVTGGAAMAAPASPTQAKVKLAAQVQALDTQLDAARTRNATLSTQVNGLEQQNAATRDKLAQRDAEIAALNKQLQAAGVGAPASGGH